MAAAFAVATRTGLARTAAVQLATAAHREASRLACLPPAGALPTFRRDGTPGRPEGLHWKVRVSATTFVVASVRVPFTLLVML